jgi:hypothetical protein
MRRARIPAAVTVAAPSRTGGRTRTRTDVLAAHTSYPPVVVTVDVAADVPALEQPETFAGARIPSLR